MLMRLGEEERAQAGARRGLQDRSVQRPRQQHAQGAGSARRLRDARDRALSHQVRSAPRTRSLARYMGRLAGRGLSAAGQADGLRAAGEVAVRGLQQGEEHRRPRLVQRPDGGLAAHPSDRRLRRQDRGPAIAQRRRAAIQLGPRAQARVRARHQLAADRLQHSALVHRGLGRARTRAIRGRKRGTTCCVEALAAGQAVQSGHDQSRLHPPALERRVDAGLLPGRAVRPVHARAVRRRRDRQDAGRLCRQPDHAARRSSALSSVAGRFRAAAIASSSTNDRGALAAVDGQDAEIDPGRRAKGVAKNPSDRRGLLARLAQAQLARTQLRRGAPLADAALAIEPRNGAGQLRPGPAAPAGRREQTRRWRGSKGRSIARIRRRTCWPCWPV